MSDLIELVFAGKVFRMLVSSVAIGLAHSRYEEHIGATVGLRPNVGRNLTECSARNPDSS